MGLFDSVSFSVATKYGAIGVSGGKIGVDMGGGLVPPQPTPLTPATPQPGTTGFMGWVKSNPKTAAGIGLGFVLALVLLLRR